MDAGEIPLDRLDGEPFSRSHAPRLDSCPDVVGDSDRLVLSKADVRLLADFFLLLDRWDRIVTTVVEQPAAPEQTAA
jgi:hypothetical protein